MTVRTRARVFVDGLRWGYPLCCVLRFAVDPQMGSQACARGAIHKERRNGSTKTWVPCALHRHSPAHHELRDTPGWVLLKAIDGS